MREDWYTTQGRCPWNQAAVAGGAAAFGRWTVRVAEAGTYRIEVRRWPRELDAPMAGIPSVKKTLLYGGAPKALPVAKTRLKVGNSVQEADVVAEDTVKCFTVKVEAGAADIETTLLDKAGKPLCSAYYVCIRRE